jgi:hypothetical protein
MMLNDKSTERMQVMVITLIQYLVVVGLFTVSFIVLCALAVRLGVLDIKEAKTGASKPQQ